MPPKSAAAKSSDADAADHEKEFVEKELSISFLKTRLSRCSLIHSLLSLKGEPGSRKMYIHNALCRHQERGDTLFIENARLGQDLETQKLNLADINEFLTGELEASSKKLRQMEEKASALQQQMDDIKEIHTVCTLQSY